MLQNGSMEANGRESKSCLGQKISLMLGIFAIPRIKSAIPRINGLQANSKAENSAKV